MDPNPFSVALNRFRESAGLTQDQLASRAHASIASISRWSSGENLPKLPNAEKLDEALGAKGKLLAEWHVAATGHSIPLWARTLTTMETTGVSAESISPLLVSGYLQSPSYARAVFRAGQPLLGGDEVERLARIRCERLHQLPKLHVTAVFPVSGITGFPEEVQQEQAAHLLEWCATGRVVVLLVPEGSVLVGITSPLLLFRLRDGSVAASSDHLTGNVVHDTESHERLSALVKGALAAALPARESRRILEGLAR